MDCGMVFGGGVVIWSIDSELLCGGGDNVTGIIMNRIHDSVSYQTEKYLYIYIFMNWI